MLCLLSLNIQDTSNVSRQTVASGEDNWNTVRDIFLFAHYVYCLVDHRTTVSHFHNSNNASRQTLTSVDHWTMVGRIIFLALYVAPTTGPEDYSFTPLQL